MQILKRTVKFNSFMINFKLYGIKENKKKEGKMIYRLKKLFKINVSFGNNRLKNVLIFLMFLGAIFVKTFYFQFTTKLNRIPYFKFENTMMLIANLGMCIILLSIVMLISNKKKSLGLLIFNLIFSFILFSDTVYYRYYYSALSVTSIYQIGFVGSLGDSIWSLVKIKDLVYILDFPVIVFILFLLNRIFKESIFHRNNRESFLKRVFKTLVISMVGVLLIFITLKNADTSTFSYDNNHIIKHGGIAYYHYYDIKEFTKNTIFRNRKMNHKEIEELTNHFNNKEIQGTNYKGISQGKNLIILQVEALQEFVINAKTPSGEEITPNLNRLINESIYFDNIYYQTGGGNTSDAELLSNASVYPAKEGSAYFLYPTNTYDSIGNILKEKGYGTYASHANNPTFWNRAIMYNALGFDEFFSNQKFEINEYIGWGLGDKSFYKQTLDKVNKKEPFYSFMISLSSHYPFNFKYFEEYKFDVGKYEGTFLGYYLKAANYADDAIGDLMDYLKEQGIYDNTLIVIYGDHQAVPKDKAEELMEFTGHDYSEAQWTELQKVPLLIHDSSITEYQTISKIGGQIDILPTIANLMDFDVPYALGKDLINTSEGYAVLRNSNVITNEFIYISAENKVYNKENGEEMDIDLYEEKIKELQNHLYISDLILKRDALKNITE